MNADPAGTSSETAGSVDPEEAALIARIAAGESRAYGVLVDRYQRRLYWSCLRLLGDADEAADVVQETFVRAYARLADYDPAYRFYTWIFRIARNRCLNVLRRRKVWGALSLSSPAEAPPLVAAGEAGARVEDRELGLALAACRGELPPAQRECFDLRHDDELSYAEIALLIEIPIGTVMSRLARAREKMQRCLEARGHGPGTGPARDPGSREMRER
ncbi:MAG: RNA polymerase sigma factor [Gemmatimonadota bacterium]